MSSSEIIKKIDALVAALADFQNQVGQAISKYQDAVSQIDSINSNIGGSQDTLVIQSIYNTNTKLSGTIAGIIGRIEGEKGNVVMKVQKRIEELREELRLALIREEKERQRQKLLENDAR